VLLHVVATVNVLEKIGVVLFAKLDVKMHAAHVGEMDAIKDRLQGLSVSPVDFLGIAEDKETSRFQDADRFLDDRLLLEAMKEGILRDNVIIGIVRGFSLGVALFDDLRCRTKVLMIDQTVQRTRGEGLEKKKKRKPNLYPGLETLFLVELLIELVLFLTDLIAVNSAVASHLADKAGGSSKARAKISHPDGPVRFRDLIDQICAGVVGALSDLFHSDCLRGVRISF